MKQLTTILLLVVASVTTQAQTDTARKYISIDTIPQLLDVFDSKRFINGTLRYSTKKVVDGYMILGHWKENEYLDIIGYLDKYKKPLPTKLVVWTARPR